MKGGGRNGEQRGEMSYTCTVEYRQSAPPIFTLGWQERGGGADKR